MSNRVVPRDLPSGTVIPAMSALARASFAFARFPADATAAFVLVPSSGEQVVTGASAIVTPIFAQAADSTTGDVRFVQDPQQANVFFTTSQQPLEERKAAFQALWREVAPATERIAEEHTWLDVRSVQTFWMQLSKLLPTGTVA